MKRAGAGAEGAIPRRDGGSVGDAEEEEKRPTTRGRAAPRGAAPRGGIRRGSRAGVVAASAARRERVSAETRDARAMTTRPRGGRTCRDPGRAPAAAVARRAPDARVLATFAPRDEVQT